MNNDHRDESTMRFARKAKASFDASVAQLDGAALSRLNRARQQALAAARRTPSRARVWLPAGGAVAAALVVALLAGRPETGTPEFQPAVAEVDVELLLAEENPEMLEELEFYYWMDQLSANVSGDM